MFKQRGQVSVTVAIVGAVATVAMGALSAYATSSARVGQVETKVEVLQERQTLQYNELKAGLFRIEEKLDKALK